MLSRELRNLAGCFEAALGEATGLHLEPLAIAGWYLVLSELARQAEALERHTVPFGARLEAANAPAGGNVLPLGRRACGAPPWTSGAGS
jgi:hypothetical protein